MRILKKGHIVRLIVSVIALFLIISPVNTFAYTYGSGNYGAGLYGTGNSSSSNSNNASNNTSSSNPLVAFFCSDQAPSSAPNLYQIDATSTTVKLYFSPAGTPYDKHYVSYGKDSNSEGHGVEFATSSSKGALTYEVKLLASSTAYTFKVRGGNGCKPGSWRNTLTIKTLTKGSKTIAKFYPKKQATVAKTQSKSWVAQATAYAGNMLPKVPNAGLGNGEKQNKQTQQIADLKSVKGIQIKEQAAQPSLWQNVSNFFSHIF
jgi:hypothetical protein